ncbi:MAG: class I SAM-dependent methyltransferase [Candidatus Dormibacteria bacterium]
MRRFLVPPKFRYLQSAFRSVPFRMLDAGAGNHSAYATKQWFPSCEYYGIDRSRDYNNDLRDFECMAGFWELDLESLNFGDIPDGFFDVLLMTHVLEHLRNGDKVLPALLPKLKPGGIVYVEFPNGRSTRLPSMRESLNFFDDPTHVRIYSAFEIINLLLDHGCQVLRGGTRRDWQRALATPALGVYRLFTRGHLVGPDFWDLLGFADFVLARRSDQGTSASLPKSAHEPVAR